jgi:SPP1 family predicted phage head-tail adaptor
MGIAAGSLDRRVRFERFGPIIDAYGGEVKDWQPYCAAWANVVFGRGEERRAAAQERASLTATFRVRANSQTVAITTADRIVFDGGMWDISSNVPFNRDGRDITAIRAA